MTRENGKNCNLVFHEILDVLHKTFNSNVYQHEKELEEIENFDTICHGNRVRIQFMSLRKL